MTNDEATRLIVLKRGSYILPVSASMTWAEKYPCTEPPKGMERGKFWQTPDGVVFAMPEDEQLI